MTSGTRRRLTLCLILGLITLPAEALLFPVALTPNPAVAATEFASSLSPEEAVAAAADIDHYPPVYRRAIMGVLEPEERSNAWRRVFSRYLDTHPSLTVEQADVVRDAMTVASPEVFSPSPNADLKARVQEIFARATRVLGPKDTGELFITLGPKAVERGNALPLRQQIADNIRSWRVVSANDGPDCNCNIEIDTCDLVPDPWLQCSEQYTCNFDMRWPMCGPLWSWACTGWCKIIRWPSID